MPKNENFAASTSSQQSTGATPVYLYNEYYKKYLHLKDNNTLELFNSKPGEPQFNLDNNGNIKYFNYYLTIFDNNSLLNINTLKNPLKIKLITNLNGPTFRLVDNYIKYTTSENTPLTINDNNTFNISYVPINKMDSKNKFVIVK